MNDGEFAIRVDDLRMRYAARDVLTGVTFDVPRGEVLVLLGPNGAGKTTTIEILEGFRMRSSGRVSVLGVDPARGDEQWRARLGIVMQSWRDHAKWRVGEFLAYQGSYYAPFATASAPRPWPVADLLDAVGLTDQAKTPIGRLSGGQRRRLDVAVGLVGRPELVLLDEPTTGFDPEARAEFHAIIHAVTTRFHTTVLLTTHDLDEAEKLASRVAVLARGEIIADGTPLQLARQIAGEDEVRWSEDGIPHTRSVADSTAFVRELFRRHGDAISALEVRRSSLEQTYLALVREAEASRTDEIERTAA
ncbi:MAG TPA: ABC transporter ATP-binding protein [Microbacterium sp.]|uniref:ABC transporter ATP-binding protein n=1 Tax=Microbacterium sp. TaxID=51671 RepID=UPI002CF344B1|nr:ABC transporter ATP-binding protein [Microbacterium sp.]HWI30867.1 ABC transporter ATP-binding protein [Microbacterium sp.]